MENVINKDLLLFLRSISADDIDTIYLGQELGCRCGCHSNYYDDNNQILKLKDRVEKNINI